MSVKNNKGFLTFFPDHVYRYIDQTGEGRPPVSSTEIKEQLNRDGYESYFTVNGFRDSANAKNESCTSLNAFFVDIDGRKDEEELERIKLKLDPSFILETKNGYHIYWLLDEPIYKDEIDEEEWKISVKKWEELEQNIVTELKADPVVKDLTRILRVPQTYYWKKTGDLWKKEDTKEVFKIKGVYKNPANRYTLEEIEETFPAKELQLDFSSIPIETGEKAKKMADAEKKNFFDRVNESFPMEQRDSFKKLISGAPETIANFKGRNNGLIIVASLMRQAGWTKEKALQQIEKVGWHGLENDPGGPQEIVNTINSAFEGGYTYSHKHELIEHNTSPEENVLMQQAITGVLKIRKEQDKVRYSNYEREILAKNPYLKKNETGIVYRYHNGVYKEVSDQEMSDIVLNGLYDDMLWGYRTKKSVSDKVACLLSVIPTLVITLDQGRWINVKNGLLNIETKELQPHTPEFVTLIQYPVLYDPEAKCPIWNECVSEWMTGPEQEDKIRLIKQYCGYILSSSMEYDRALFMVGNGGNGKSTFIDTIGMIIGMQATSYIDLEGLYGQFGMKGLVGKRLNIIEEVAGNYYQSNKLKKLISGEQITIDVKYKPQYTFRPQAKFVFSVNSLPRMDDTSSATERRMCVVQFRQNYRKNPNTKLRSDTGLLNQERSGILNWMLEGAVDLQESDGFITTNEQTKMLDDYRAENSSVEGFLSECIVMEPGMEITTPELYRQYKEWSLTEGGRKIKASITFTKEVRAYASKDDRFTYEDRDYSGGDSKFVGIKLAPQWKNRDNF